MFSNTTAVLGYIRYNALGNRDLFHQIEESKSFVKYFNILFNEIFLFFSIFNGKLTVLFVVF